MNGVSMWHKQWTYSFNQKSKCATLILSFPSLLYNIFCVLTKQQLYSHPSILKYLKLPVIVFHFVKSYFKPNNVSVSSHFSMILFIFPLKRHIAMTKKYLCQQCCRLSVLVFFQMLFAQSSVLTLVSLNYILYEDCILLRLFKYIRMMTIQ